MTELDLPYLPRLYTEISYEEAQKVGLNHLVWSITVPSPNTQEKRLHNIYRIYFCTTGWPSFFFFLFFCVAFSFRFEHPVDFEASQCSRKPFLSGGQICSISGLIRLERRI